MKFRLAIGCAGRGVDQHDVERLERIADAIEFALHVVGGADIAVRLVAEIEFHAVGEAPLQRHLVDGDGALAVVHGRMKMIRRVEMRAVVGRDRHRLDRRAHAVRQLFRPQAGELRRQCLRRLPCDRNR